MRDGLAVADREAAQHGAPDLAVAGRLVPERLGGERLRLELQVAGRGVDRELVDQEAVGLQQLVGQVVDERADLVAGGVRGDLGVDLVEQRVRDRQRSCRTTSRFAGAKPCAAANRSAGASSRSSNRYDDPLITSVRPRPPTCSTRASSSAPPMPRPRRSGSTAGNTNALSRLSSSDSQAMPPPTIRSPSKIPSASARWPGEGSRRATAISSKDWKVFQGRPSSISARQPISWNRRSWASSWTSIGRVCIRPPGGGRRTG